MVNDVEWYKRKSHVDATEEEIKAVEDQWGVTFPSDYREVAKEYHGCTPLRKKALNIGEREEAFKFLLSFSENSKSLYILDVYNNIKDRLVDNVYPFANDPFGNCYCFDYRQSNTQPTIVFWDHEEAYENPEEGLSYLCNSFAELLNHLEELKDS
ncbi:SMI1/KNR4 family protein [Aneurinibacillus tyrosinisolvens]|uniref:SMI1/KNR4 family protein n=1 Tax=Aneurinibacillus tyrosinisolvens TaxID=1443435 RepID=UPI00063F407A|nr:SMI1/KNR4 family protein [Aneurinibacillus tyrosinisolvens]